MGELEGAGEIAIARALTPAQVSELREARAIVSEFGGLLGHAAAMARELRVPYVVGCVGAWGGLATGDEVVVDGDAGLVVRLSR
jgi:phosphoenolpyruvate-protein kinase (PTS system EI component)